MGPERIGQVDAGLGCSAPRVRGHRRPDPVQGRRHHRLGPDVRGKAGLFLAFQYPQEIAGVSVLNFLRQALSARKGIEMSRARAAPGTDGVDGQDSTWISRFMERYVNEGFSGGEKKRNEILQMAVLEPEMAVLDETDSGLDIDALAQWPTVFSGAARAARARHPRHHPLPTAARPSQPDRSRARRRPIVASGGPELTRQLETDGYESFR